ncbi:MAG TPA: ATP-binding protein, partial [Parafilimonas sp.]|nr:ATP-binding protein [Parafilimonas sp.]
QYYYAAIFKAGGLFALQETELSEEAKKLIKRFANVFDLTYTRFLDLQKAEANAREAMKRAALDRIRADIASMRTVNDLNKITPLIWNELTILGLSFIRCGVFIMDREEQLIHTFLSTPDGKAIAAFNLPFDTPGNFRVMLDHWRNKKIYIDQWNRDDFNDIAEILVNQGAIGTKEQYITSIPAEGFYLNFLPFLQGMLYVGNTEKLNEEQIDLIRQVAEAFSTAYARYEDFNKLELAKQQIETTYSELKSAQAQLIQAEKMASLGELTAGIAHEIQNPLNFVNNFSEVNGELVDELKAQLATGNLQLASEIADDLKENETKILHHGKRADAIVKGMLQHSRTSTSQKELADINALCDEYLRLSYHGMRGKDKNFNAEIRTDFDASVGKINVVPQDIGRVLLNLYNNAFYAVSEKSKNPEGFENPRGLHPYVPTVTLVTKKLDGKILIAVKDNGAGIPQNIIDKIFQPFFTTKPTGEGTGLGLSLSYDIIKAHGGEIKVETKEGNESEFIIELPY